MNTFDFNYKTTLPKEANAPYVTIRGNTVHTYDVLFYIRKPKTNDRVLLKTIKCKTGETVSANINQWFMLWNIEVHLNGILVANDVFDPTNKIIFIKMDGYALGDNIAWMPYVEVFREKYNTTIICSTFFNNLFKDVYPNILFVAPNTNVDNIYAQYYIGAVTDEDPKYSPVISEVVPLQMVASSLLYLNNTEVRPNLDSVFEPISLSYKKYVIISEFASHEKKMWKYPDGWQIIVDYLNSIDYEVVVISKEPTSLNYVINLTGDYTIETRAHQLGGCEFFMGVSSGLSWLAWAMNKHVFLISDVTHVDHEFKSNVTRICANNDLTEVNYGAPSVTNPNTVISAIKNYLESKS